MKRREFFRVAGVSVVGTTVITEKELVSTVTADSASTGDSAGPDRNSDTHGPALSDTAQTPPEESPSDEAINETSTDQEQFTLSGQLAGNYSSEAGTISVELPGENKSVDVISDGSFTVDVPSGTLLDVAYVERNQGDRIFFNGNPDVYYIEAFDQVSEDQDLGIIEIPESNVLDLQFENESGEPLDGITVAVRSLDTETDRWWQIFTPTNADGFYQFNNSPTGIEVAGGVQVAVLEDTDDSRVPDLDVIVDERLSITESQTESYTVDPIRASGEFVNPNDESVTGDTVTIFTNPNNSVNVTAGQDGGFEVRLPQSTDFVEGAYEIQYSRAGIVDRDEPIRDGDWVELYAGPQLEGTSDRDIGTVRLPDGDLVAAQVIDEAGTPIEDAMVQYIHRNQVQGTTASLFYPTDETGVIDIDGRSGIRLSGTVTLSVTPPDNNRFIDTTVEETIIVDGATTVEVELPEKSTVDGYRNDQGVVDTDGLLNAAADFRNGEIDTDTLLDVASLFRSGNPVA